MKIYASRGPINNYNDDSIIFYFDDWEFVQNIEDADIVIGSEDKVLTADIELYKNLNPDQILMIMYMGANHNAYNPDLFRCVQTTNNTLLAVCNAHERTLIVHANLLDDCIDPTIICFDIMYNREKLYCTDYNDSLINYDSIWMRNFPKSTFELGDINKQYNQNNKHFLVANRPQHLSTNEITKDFEGTKVVIRDFIKEYAGNISYLSDPKNGIFFSPNGWDSSIIITSQGQWAPVGDQYYNTSYVSICIETITDGNDLFSLSEKAFDPLIKGNFLLPFSNKHMVKRCKEIYGFKFPDWIDYSYDDIENYDDRFVGFCNTIKTLSRIPLDQLHELYVRDKHILEHNRNVFYSRPYDKLLPKIKRSIERLGW